MAQPPCGVAAVRLGVRRSLATLPPGPVLVACSGGADSLALASAVAFEVDKTGRPAGAVVVDHGLQPGSDAVAARAADQCRALGLAPVLVERVEVRPGPDGPEAAARVARYAALDAARERTGAVAVLLAHTRDDQAEQVLLGLARGSGARSLAAMAPVSGPWVRPLLDVPREATAQACAHDGLVPWSDPHNADRRYARVRARQGLALLEDDLGPGLAAALARSARLLRADADALDAIARDAADRLGPTPDVAALAALPDAVRTRVLRLLAVRAGSPPGCLTAVHVDGLDRLVTAWRGQGPVHLPGALVARRERTPAPGPRAAGATGPGAADTSGLHADAATPRAAGTLDPRPGAPARAPARTDRGAGAARIVVEARHRG